MSFTGYLRQYAGVTICIGPFIQMASANTPYATSIEKKYIFISKAGAVGAQKNDAGAASNCGTGVSGYLYTHLNGTDTDTVGILRLFAQHHDTLIIDNSYQVVSPVIYSSLYESGTSENASVYLPVDVKYVGGTTITATGGRMDVLNLTGVISAGATLAAGSITSAVVATDAIDDDALSADAVTSITAGIWAATNRSVHNVIGIVGAGVTVSDKTGFSLAADQDVRNVLGIVSSGVTVQAGEGAGQLNLSNGRIGINWADIAAPTTTQNLSGTRFASVGNVEGIVGIGVTVAGMTAAALADFFDTDSTTTYAAAAAGSVVKEIADNAGGASLTTADIATAVTRALSDCGVTVALMNANVITASAIATDAFDDDAISVDAITSIVTGVWGATAKDVRNLTGAISSGATLAADQDVRNILGVAANGVTISSGTGTGQLNLSTGRVGINWGDVINQATAVNLSGTSIASGVTASDIWAFTNRQLTALDEDVTSIDLNGSTIGTVTTVTNAVTVSSGTGAGQINLSSGRVGINWGDVLNPNTAVNLSGTSIASGVTTQDLLNLMNTAIPAAPTADSIWQYIQQLKWVLVNQMSITEANGDTRVYKDDDASTACSIAAVFTTAAGITTRKRLET